MNQPVQEPIIEKIIPLEGNQSALEALFDRQDMRHLVDLAREWKSSGMENKSYVTLSDLVENGIAVSYLSQLFHLQRPADIRSTTNEGYTFLPLSAYQAWQSQKENPSLRDPKNPQWIILNNLEMDILRDKPIAASHQKKNLPEAIERMRKLGILSSEERIDNNIMSNFVFVGVHARHYLQ